MRQRAEAVPEPAVPFIVRAFDRYPIVAMSEMHGSPETMELIQGVVRHHGFRGAVTDIVIEFGNARYQGLVDRYVAGESVRDSDLRQVWENTTQTTGVWCSPI